MIEVLKIVSDSWPIAAMFVALCTTIAIRRSFKQAMDNDRANNIDRYSGNKSVVVQGREYDH